MATDKGIFENWDGRFKTGLCVSLGDDMLITFPNSCWTHRKTEAETLANDILEIDRLKAIKQKAVEVRAAQDRYFRTRRSEHLQDSKRLEKELDDLLTNKLF